MTLTETASLCAAGTGLAAWIASCINAWKLRRVAKQLEVVHVATNSLVTKLLAEGKAASYEKGRLEGRDER